MRFEFATAGRIIFGNKTINEAGKSATEFGTRALVVTGASTDRCEPLLVQLKGHGVDHRIFSVRGEPTISLVEQGSLFAKQEKCDLVIGFGGGSALDAGKAIAILTTNSGDVYDYLEVIGKNKSFLEPPIPYIAIPTTAGTGTEVTRNAVLGSKEHKVKVSLRSPMMLPALAIIDPQLTYNLPSQITAFSGMDALSQLIEPFVSCQANPLTDAFCREGIWKASRSLEKACMSGNDIAAREDMSLASLLSGLALANSKLGAVHGFAGPIGGMLDAPHGAICASLLAPVFSVNVRALTKRQPESKYLRRYKEISQILIGDHNSGTDDGIEWVKGATKNLGIPPLRNWGLKKEAFETLIEKAAVASSMAGNPIKLTNDELKQILTMAY